MKLTCNFHCINKLFLLIFETISAATMFVRGEGIQQCHYRSQDYQFPFKILQLFLQSFFNQSGFFFRDCVIYFVNLWLFGDFIWSKDITYCSCSSWNDRVFILYLSSIFLLGGWIFSESDCFSNHSWYALFWMLKDIPFP